MGYEFHSAQRKPASIRTSRNSSINTNPTTVSDHEQEATELNPVDHEDVVSTHDAAPWTRNGSINSCHTTSDQAQLQKRHWYDFVSRFWRHYIQLSVPHVDCRDHLANERTFLAYQRTSVALSMIGIVTTQLFNLQRAQSSHASFGYFVLSKPLGALFQVAAILVTAVGAHRYWRQQMNMARGKVRAGGWEIYAIMGTVFALVALVFSLLIVVDVNEERVK